MVTWSDESHTNTALAYLPENNLHLHLHLTVYSLFYPVLLLSTHPPLLNFDRNQKVIHNQGGFLSHKHKHVNMWAITPHHTTLTIITSRRSNFSGEAAGSVAVEGLQWAPGSASPPTQLRLRRDGERGAEDGGAGGLADQTELRQVQQGQHPQSPAGQPPPSSPLLQGPFLPHGILKLWQTRARSRELETRTRTRWVPSSWPLLHAKPEEDVLRWEHQGVCGL